MLEEIVNQNQAIKLPTRKTTNLSNLAEYLKNVPANSKIYLGCDSERKRKDGVWWADYCIVAVVHKGGNNGCKIFGEIVRERDYDQKINKPSYRLMNEVYKITAFYLENFELLDPFHPEIHLDINPDEEYGSSCVITQAVGYVKAVSGLEAKVKPEAFSASYAADRFAYINSTKKYERKRERRKQRKTERKMRRNGENYATT